MRVRPSRRPRRDVHAIAEHVVGAYSGPLDLVATGISVASARVESGDLFVALPGGNAHGAEYAGDAVARGAVAVLTD
ncbi:MAG TPA: Mur ligase domain-containing protein, partial [Aeromicrobium sp.]|nr:Mur ligase domain-containing protein [Aeromicrobium sp.]